MNKDNAKDYLHLVQALAEGRVIQLERHGLWQDMNDCEEISFCGPLEKWRIKSEPRIVWVPPENAMDYARYCKDLAQAEERVSLYGGHITEVTE